MGAGLFDAVMAPVLAAFGAVGNKVLTSVEDETANQTVRLGWQLLARLRRSATDGAARPQLEAAAAAAAANPADRGFEGALRGQVKKALAGDDGVDDPDLAADLAGILAASGVTVAASDTRVAAAGGHDSTTSSAGDGSTVA